MRSRVRQWSLALGMTLGLGTLALACGGGGQDVEPIASSTTSSSSTSSSPPPSEATSTTGDDTDDGVPFSVDAWPAQPVIGEGPAVGVDDDGTPGTQLGPIAIPETSALIASRLEDDVYWTIQDRAEGEDRAALVGLRIIDGAIDTDYGADGLRSVQVRDVANVDWETLAPGPDGTLLIGDLGNNDCRRADQKILQVSEPQPADTEVDLVARWQIDFPDTAEVCGGKNTEAMTILETTLTLLTKTEPPVLYQLEEPNDGDNVARRLGPIAQPAGGFTKLVTGMAANDAGDRVVVTTAGERFWVYDIDGPVLESLATDPPRWSRRYDIVPDTQIEGAAFVPGTDDLVLIGENRSVWLWPAELYEEGELG